MVVYGASQPEFKEAFLAEHVQTCAKEELPLLVGGGDFKIIQNPQEKNNDNYNDRGPFLPIVVIDSLDMRKLELSNQKIYMGKFLGQSNL